MLFKAVNDAAVVVVSRVEPPRRGLVREAQLQSVKQDLLDDGNTVDRDELESM